MYIVFLYTPQRRKIIYNLLIIKVLNLKTTVNKPFFHTVFNAIYFFLL